LVGQQNKDKGSMKVTSQSNALGKKENMWFPVYIEIFVLIRLCKRFITIILGFCI